MRVFLFVLSLVAFSGLTQDIMTPELLWKFGRVSGGAISPDNKQVLYGVSRYDIAENSGQRDLFVMPFKGGRATNLTNGKASYAQEQWSADGKSIYYLASYTDNMQLWKMDLATGNETQITQIEGGIDGYKIHEETGNLLYIKSVKLDQTVNEVYPDLPKADARIIDDLMYRHWSSWHDFSYSHIFYAPYRGDKITVGADIMKGERFDSPLNPFGGIEQICFANDGMSIYYTCKKMSGKDWAVSTNSDIYQYDIPSKNTKNVTEGMMGYDTEPSLSKSKKLLTWLSMKEDGFESDKNDIITMDISTGEKRNLTEGIDLTITHYTYGYDDREIYFTAVIDATYQVFKLNTETLEYRQITNGIHNITSVQFSDKGLLVGKQDMNHATELYTAHMVSGVLKQLTHVNDDIYGQLKTSPIEKRWITTTDNKKMLTWVIYPPNFDSTKTYPTLLYCQGGPQSAVSQFYSFRWNFQLMAANGYIIVAPNRRGLPGFGQEWNDAISGDWGGQPIKDYLTAIDTVAAESYVDNERLGAVGASYGGYSVYFLAGNHEKRFKTFISHCGLFNLESWYGTTEELFFANKDIGGNYWDENRPKSYEQFSPHKYLQNWDTPILVIHGERDYRVPISEGMQAFQAAKLMGLETKFLYFPGEGHWVLNPQNGLLWHREYFKWLDSYLK